MFTVNCRLTFSYELIALGAPSKKHAVLSTLLSQQQKHIFQTLSVVAVSVCHIFTRHVFIILIHA